MTTTINDLKGGMSNCCGAKIYIDYGICSGCKEHCEEVKECVGCDTTENLEKCHGTMCIKCWEAECEEPNFNEEESNA